MPTASGKICFGCWQLDVQRRMLCAHGTPMAVHGRGFDLLVFLVERRGRPVGKEEIFAGVWAGSTVSDGNLAVQISNLRKALDDSGPNGGGLIVTVPGRGYMFTGELVKPPSPALPPTSIDSAESSPPTAPPGPSTESTFRLTNWVVRTAGLAVILIIVLGGAALVWRSTPNAPRLSIAVLPFRSLSADPAQAYLADALTDDLITDLAHIPASTVIARESAEVWRRKPADVRQIAAALRVRYIVEGSIIREDSAYHVNAQLVDGTNGSQLWTLRFSANDGHIGEVRDTIVRQLAAELRFQLIQIVGSRSWRDRPDAPDALDQFYRARAMLDVSETLASLTEAQHLLEQAVKDQPDFADALAELGAVLITKVHNTDDADRAHDMVEAKAVIANALTLSPTHSQAIAAEAHRLEITGDCANANIMAGNALAIEPSNVSAEGTLADCARKLGHLDEAVTHLKVLLRLNPIGPKTRGRHLTLGYIYLLQGSAKSAVDELLQALSDFLPDRSQDSMGRDEFGSLMLIAALEMLHDHDEAHSRYLDYERVWPHRTVWRVGAQFTKQDAAYPGMKPLLDALHVAGMPFVADEHAGADSSTETCNGGEYGATPAKVAGAALLDTATVGVKLRTTNDVLLFDLSEGAASPPTAIWYDYTKENEKAEDYVVHVSKDRAIKGVDTSIIVMGNGAYGCTPVTAVEALLQAGFRNVGWYRGGEEAWANAGKPFIDRRPI